MNTNEVIYNTRVRQAISDEYIECSNMYSAIHKKCAEIESKLQDRNTKKTLSYEEYIDLEKYLNSLKEEMKTIKIQIDVWNAAREICLDIADEIFRKSEGG
jgi:hypothetical protein